MGENDGKDYYSIILLLKWKPLYSGFHAFDISSTPPSTLPYWIKLLLPYLIPTSFNFHDPLLLNSLELYNIRMQTRLRGSILY